MEVVPSQYGSNQCAISFCHLKLKNAKFKYCYHITFLQIAFRELKWKITINFAFLLYFRT